MTDFRRKKVTDFRHALAMTGELGAVEWSVCTRNDGRHSVTDFRRKKVTVFCRFRVTVFRRFRQEDVTRW